jgi:Lipase (class 3)
MTDPNTDISLLDFLRGVLAGSGTEVIVTGHSLGGALVTVLAPWLYDQLPKAGRTRPVAVTPYTFAAPTAGNQAFVNYYTSLFANAYRCVNTLDIVAMAWANLATLLDMYPSPGQSLWNYSKALYFLVDLTNDCLSKTCAQTNQQSGAASFQGPAQSASNSFAGFAGIALLILIVLVGLGVLISASRGLSGDQRRDKETEKALALAKEGSYISLALNPLLPQHVLANSRARI